MIVITSSDIGRHRVGSRGDLPLPASLRQLCRFEPGQPVLLATLVDHDTLIVHPFTVVVRLLATLHADLSGEDRDR
ncbi:MULTISPECIES: hypothetical protein [Micromonospora]|uniref:hypothetical protein n=1 Tax=Micromonospora TaxID=1873 RepID=UPI00259C87FC|nr:hypothetical protein [Micromonospora sp. b486]MDM4781358.1 hypothetical protein [Micromonospora sp. b486]